MLLVDRRLRTAQEGQVELGLGLFVPATGARADVVVRAAERARLDEVTPLLLARVLPAGVTGRLSAGGVPLDPGALLGVPPLVQGALLQVDAPLPPASLAGLPELRVVGGPDAGAVHRLSPGEVVVGRDPLAGVRIADRDVSREHCRLRVAHDGASVLDLGSTNGTTVDGVPVSGSVDLRPGAVLRIGESSLVLVPPAEPAAPLAGAPAGRLAFNRPPRLRAPAELVQVVVPSPPREREKNPIPLIAIVAPLVLGIAMWQLTGSTMFLLFTLLSPVLVLGNLVTERRSGKRRTRKEIALWRAQREVAESTLFDAVRADERARRVASPDPAEVMLTALGPRPRLWERRRDDDDLLDVRVGLADQPARVEAEGDLAPGWITARSVPVVVPLREAGVLGIAGPRGSGQALARWVVGQCAVWHSPRDLQLVVLAEPAAASAWEWVRWLPHARPDSRQDCRALLGLGLGQAAFRVGELTALVEARRAEKATAARGARTDDRPVLLVVDGARALRAVPGLPRLLSEGRAVGVYAVCLEDDPRLLPEECGATAVLHGGAAMDVRATGRADVSGVADLVPARWADAVARALAPLHDDSRDRSGAEGLPPSVRWADVVELPLVGGDEDVSRVVERWAAPGRSTTAALGRSADGVFSVDITRDGPHGLVAGTTGSGKSELLQTLIASACRRAGGPGPAPPPRRGGRAGHHRPVHCSSTPAPAPQRTWRFPRSAHRGCRRSLRRSPCPVCRSHRIPWRARLAGCRRSRTGWSTCRPSRRSVR